MTQGDHISLFSGIGATDLAAEALGFETVVTAEVESFCRSVLETRFSRAAHFKDVRDVTLDDLALLRFLPDIRPRPLLISGGFPCQDVASLRGDSYGLDRARSGLWVEFARIIGEFRPDYVLIENSPLLRSRGLDRVLADLHRLGYDARWDCIPAAAVGAPHLRDRVWIIARPTKDTPAWWESSIGYVHANQDIVVDNARGACGQALKRFPRAGEMCGRFVRQRDPEYTVRQARAIRVNMKLYPTPRSAPNEWRTTRNAPSHGKSHGATLAGTLNDEDRRTGYVPAPSSESAGNIDPGVVEWFMGLPYGWTNPSIPRSALIPHDGWNRWPKRPYSAANVPDRRARLGALGNALVPQVAEIALHTLVNDWR